MPGEARQAAPALLAPAALIVSALHFPVPLETPGLAIHGKPVRWSGHSLDGRHDPPHPCAAPSRDITTSLWGILARHISIDNIAPQGHFTTGTRISNPSPHFVHGKQLAHALGLTVSDLLGPPNGTLDLLGPGDEGMKDH